MEAKSAPVNVYGSKWWTCGFASLLWLLAFAAGWAQTPKIKYFPSKMTGGLSPVMDLQGIWFDENGNRHIVPFNHFDRDEMELTREFDLPAFDLLQDTLFLYCEAVAWSSEILLNDKLLVVTEDPFAEHLLPLEKDWLKPSGNVLKIRLSTAGLSFPWYPKRFLGVFRQILLLQVDSLPSFPAFPKTLSSAPKAALFAAWTPEQQYRYDSSIVKKLSEGLFSFPYRVPIAFPFRPSNQSIAILGMLGWEVLASPDSADSLAAYNAYPFSTEAEHKNLHFWRDAQMRPAASYGHYQGMVDVEKTELNQPDRATLVIFLLLPVFCMLLIKLVAPKAYGSLGEYLTKTKIYLDLIADNKFLKVEQRWLMNSLRMVMTAVTFSLFLYYVELSESWRLLNVFGSHSVLYKTMYGVDFALWEIFLWVLAIVFSLNLAKYFLINGIGTIFRVFTLGPSLQNLDVFAAFPLNLGPFIPATFIFFLDPSAGAVVLRVWAVLFLLYNARRVWLLYSGLGRLYQISASLKFLYICTLEILPWVILV